MAFILGQTNIPEKFPKFFDGYYEGYLKRYLIVLFKKAILITNHAFMTATGFTTTVSINFPSNLFSVLILHVVRLFVLRQL